VISAEEHARFAAKHPAVTGERALFLQKLWAGKALWEGVLTVKD